MTRKFDTELMKVADEFADFDLLRPKTRPGPQFHTQETQTMFILIVQLNDSYTHTNLTVERNEEGSRIKISGQKPVQDMLMVGENVVKKDIEMKGFENWFKVPKRVVCDQISARFNADDSELVIRMPKVVKGLTGDRIEELKVEEVRDESTKLLQVHTMDSLSDQEIQEKDEHGDRQEGNGEKSKSPCRVFKICTSLIVGSALAMSLIVFVFHLVESQKQESSRKKKKQD